MDFCLMALAHLIFYGVNQSCCYEQLLFFRKFLFGEVRSQILCRIKIQVFSEKAGVLLLCCRTPAYK